MTTRNSTSVIVTANVTRHDGTTAVTHYGPFLPHAGSATTHFVNRIDVELEETGRYRHWNMQTAPAPTLLSANSEG